MLKPSTPVVKRDNNVPQAILASNSTVLPAVRPSFAQTISGNLTAQNNQKIDPSGGGRLLVGPDVRLKGAEIVDCDTLVVEGSVEAVLNSRVIRIAEKGAVSGKVGIDIAEIRGTFVGELNVRDQLIIHATGKVSGVIRYGRVHIEEGGQLCGDIQMLSRQDAETIETNLSTAV